MQRKALLHIPLCGGVNTLHDAIACREFWWNLHITPLSLFIASESNGQNLLDFMLNKTLNPLSFANMGQPLGMPLFMKGLPSLGLIYFILTHTLKAIVFTTIRSLKIGIGGSVPSKDHLL